MRNAATCAGWRSQRIAVRTSSTAAGYGCCGCEPVVDREHHEAELRQQASVVDEGGLVADGPTAGVQEHDGGALLRRRVREERVEQDRLTVDGGVDDVVLLGDGRRRLALRNAPARRAPRARQCCSAALTTKGARIRLIRTGSHGERRSRRRRGDGARVRVHQRPPRRRQLDRHAGDDPCRPPGPRGGARGRRQRARAAAHRPGGGEHDRGHRHGAERRGDPGARRRAHRRGRLERDHVVARPAVELRATRCSAVSSGPRSSRAERRPSTGAASTACNPSA